MRCRVVLVATAVAAAAVLAGCSGPAPAPTPSATGFSSEEEAFAAAEETYRAYVSALNRARLNPTAIPSPESYLTDSALETDHEASQQMRDAGVHIEGDSRVARVIPIGDPWIQNKSISILVCLDSSNTRVIDDRGSDVTPADRITPSLLRVDFAFSDDAWLIAHSELQEQGKC